MRPGATTATAGLLLLLAGFAAGCASVSHPSATVSARATTSAGQTSSAVSSARLVPAATVTAIRAAIDAVNAAAGGTPAQQRAVLQKLVDPARAQDQRGCPTAKTTVRFDASWDDLRADPNGAAQTYVLPTLIKIYTADRITGTDVTALVISVSGRRAQLPPLCVS